MNDDNFNDDDWLNLDDEVEKTNASPTPEEAPTSPSANVDPFADDKEERSSEPSGTTDDANVVNKSLEDNPFDEPPKGPSTQPFRGGAADIVLLVDVTGSMTPCINALRDSIKKFMTELAEGSAEIEPVDDWRARVVGYRDYLHDAKETYGWLCDNDFTRDVDELKHQLDKLTAKGGGDEPESLLDAIQVVLDAGELSANEQEVTNGKQWRNYTQASRILVVFTDASYHESMSVPGHEGETFDNLAEKIHAFRLHGFVYVPNIPQYEQSFEELSRFIITYCGNGAESLGNTMSDPEKLRDILQRLKRGISRSSASF